MTQKNERTVIWLWAALAAAFLLALWIQGPRLANPYTVEEDMRNLPWLHRLADPEILAGDPLTNRRITDVRVGGVTIPVYGHSPGYSLLIWSGSFLVEPILFTKLLVFPLLFVSVYYLFHIGLAMGGPRRAFALSLAYVFFNLVSSTGTSAIGGLQRSFMLPFLLALIYYLMEERYWPAAAVLFVSGAIYPPIPVLGAAVYGLSLVRLRGWRRLPAINWTPGIPLLVASLLLAIILFPLLREQLQNAPAAAQGGRQSSLFSIARFQAGGRRELFDIFPLVGRVGVVVDTPSLLHLLFLTVPAIVTLLFRPQSLSRLPRALQALFWASGLTFAAAWVAMLLTSSFPLYLPSRYTQASLPLFLLMLVVANAPETLQQPAAWLRRQRRRTFFLLLPVGLLAAAVALLAPETPAGVQNAFIVRFRRPLLLSLSALLLLLGLLSTIRDRNETLREEQIRAPRLSRRVVAALGLALLLPAIWYLWAFHPLFYVAGVTERRLYQFLETLPAEARLGGDPQALSGVPIFAKRAVLFSEETPVRDEGLMMDAILAYYATDLATVADFCHDQGVDFLVVDERDFSDGRIERGKYLFEPYDSALYPKLAERGRFALQALPPDMKLFQAGELYVVSCEDLAARALVTE